MSTPGVKGKASCQKMLGSVSTVGKTSVRLVLMARHRAAGMRRPARINVETGDVPGVKGKAPCRVSPMWLRAFNDTIGSCGG